MVITYLEFSNSHLTGSDGPGFANAHIVEHSTCLNTLNVLNKNVVLLKLVDRESHSNGNGKWKTFWDCYHQKNNGSDTNISSILQSCIGQELLFCRNDFDHYEDCLGDDADEGGHYSILANLLGCLVEFIL